MSPLKNWASNAAAAKNMLWPAGRLGRVQFTIILALILTVAIPGLGCDQNSSRWDVRVPKGTKLALIKQQLQTEVQQLPMRDSEDKSKIPLWFRVYLRRTNPDLPISGPYQYPRSAVQILQMLIKHPNSVDPAKVGVVTKAGHR